MRLLLAVGSYAASLALVAVTAFVVTLVLAGPHAGLLPHWAEVIVLVAGWLAVLVLPVWVARAVWRRVGDPSSRE